MQGVPILSPNPLRQIDSVSVVKSITLAIRAHEGQKRKWTNDPFIVHPARVAEFMRGIPSVQSHQLSASWLHDVIEKCKPKYAKEIRDDFPSQVYSLVLEVTPITNLCKESKEANKRRNRQRLRFVSDQAKLLKLVDKVDKLREITDSVPIDYISRYADDARSLLPILTTVSADLAEEIKLVSQILDLEITRLERMVYENRE